MSELERLLAELCPDGVEFRALGDLGDRNPGVNITAALMRTLAIDGGPVRVFAGGQTTADVAEESVDTRAIIRIPSIIVKSRGHIDFTYYENPFVHKAELWSYSINNGAVEQKFVYYFLKTQVDQLRQRARANSVKLPQLAVRDTDLLRIPVPPLEVQRAIVAILDKMEALEAELAAELEAEMEARRRQYAHYRDALLTVDEACEVPWVPMGEVGTFIRGRRFTRNDLVSDGLPAIHYGDIYTRLGVAADLAFSSVRPELASRLRFAQPGDVVIAAVGETVEDVAKAVAWVGDDPVAIHDDTFLFRSDLEAKFVSYFMQTRRFHEQKARHVARAKVKRLSREGLAMIEIPIPPSSDQQRIVAILDSFDALVNDLSSGLPAEIAARRKQYEYYRDRLLSFEELVA